LREINSDCIVVVAYGQILPKEILELPKYGCINVHASLLPRYRGAAPIQRCIQYGETVTGVTTMYMAQGLDTGDMIMKREVEIAPDMTGSELHDRLSECGAELIVQTLEALGNGTAVRTPQTDENTCYASMISKEELKLDFSLSAKQVYDFIRAMADSPCAYTIFGGKRLKVYRAILSETESEAPAGTVVNPERFAVVCGDGKCVEFAEIQPEGGKRMDIAAFLRGRKPDLGTILG
jgi:methionyl-tRNA formyltransferase